jgi:hypothetical protein
MPPSRPQSSYRQRMSPPWDGGSTARIRANMVQKAMRTVNPVLGRLSWYLRRLQAMSVDEVVPRSHRSLIHLGDGVISKTAPRLWKASWEHAAEHDGFERLRDAVTHRRALIALSDEALLVVARLTAPGTHRYSQRWPLHPVLEVETRPTERVVARRPGSGVLSVLRVSRYPSARRAARQSPQSDGGRNGSSRRLPAGSSRSMWRLMDRRGRSSFDVRRVRR